MKNYIKEGAILAIVAATTIVSGQGVLAGAIFGIACSDIANGATGNIQVKGVFDIAKSTGVTFSIGDRVYWDAAVDKVTSVAAGNRLIGYATAAGLTADTTLSVSIGEFQSPVLTKSATLDFASIATTASADLTIAVVGAAVGDPVSLGLPAAPAAGLVFLAFVSATDVVTVRAMNMTGTGVDAASASYKVAVHKA